ncbi:FadR family transcriptional regulator [Leifsonia shinshuensis]|uniref:FadR/GntR family transcriptional regulator n=1 Tax=Leifsonia shinshuensis TaxID=150026 RepID=UPI001F514FB9|nr:FadR/GntR family transcriptional regulator [Leifsonia shinshuensis]MCI0157063.1 FadR family transcriptional regulator [Leifsonia shinshuensis]
MTRISPNVTLSEQVADQLRRRIADGEFPVGSLIPTEAELTHELGVSRNSVREALRSLVHVGLLGARAGYGTFVLATSEVAPTLARRLDHERAVDVAEVRLLLEREAARLAAIRRTPEQLQRLQGAAAERIAQLGGPGYEDADIEFHHLLLEASGNALLAELYRGVGGNEQALLATRSAADAAVADGPSAIDDAHDAIVEAVAAGDPVAAEAAATHAVRLVNEKQGILLPATPASDRTGSDR